jgi:hypothetical protein
MAKRTAKQDDDLQAAVLQMENEGAPPLHRRTIRYCGKHPLIRRCGYVLAPDQCVTVPVDVARILLAAGDCEDVTEAPRSPGAGDPADAPES